MNIPTRSELRGSITTGGELASTGSLPDPRAWCDLIQQKDAAADLMRRRISEDRSPLVPQVVRWPKETGGYRQMIWLDPVDQVVYRSVVGRLLPGIHQHLDDSSVFSSLLEKGPPEWRLAGWWAQTGERRRRAIELLAESPVLGLFDIKNFYPSVDLAVLERVLRRMSLDQASLEFLLGWLGQLVNTYSAPGLPTGHDPSRVLADGLLTGCDQALSRRSVPFIRYVDDTWCFLRGVTEFEQISDLYQERLHSLGLELHPEKTRWLVGPDAVNEVQNITLTYIGDALTTPGPEGLEVSLQLFEHALEDLPERKTELRRAINALKGHKSVRPLHALQEDLELLRYAPDHWARYLQALLMQKETRKAVDAEWMVEEIVRYGSDRDEMFRSLVFLRAMSRMQLEPELGHQIGSLIASTEGWLAPMRVWSSHVWGGSAAFRPDRGLELFEASGDYSTKRGLALTFDKRRDSKKIRIWLDRIRRFDVDMEPTVRWLEN